MHSGDFIVQILRLSITVLILIFRMKRPEIDEKSLKIQRGNQNLYVEEEQTTQWPKEKV